MKILVRLPNWLGDMVMAVGALHRIRQLYPAAEVSVICKKGIHVLMDFFPPVHQVFVFSKEEYSGPIGAWRFGRRLRKQQRFDLFISLPDSFSSALIGLASGSKKRVGYRAQGRGILLTQSFKKPAALHRAEEYAGLINRIAGAADSLPQVTLHHTNSKQPHIVININSEASSRRLPTAKAVEIISAVRASYQHKIYLVGAPNEAPFVEEVLAALPDKSGIESVAGKTTLLQVAELLASAQAVLTTDSGPAHLANAFGTPTVVLFGAGNESNTAPYNKAAVQTIRLGQLSCEPCTANVCVRYGSPKCLELLDTTSILSLLKNAIR